jgi:hypothetical protein
MYTSRQTINSRYYYTGLISGPYPNEDLFYTFVSNPYTGMENLIIQATRRTPLVIVDFGKGLIEMKGNSFPEDPTGFFQKIEKAMDDYINNPAEKTIVNIKLGVFNTSTSKWLLYLFLRLREFSQTKEKYFEINWYYEREDEDSLEAGESYKAVLKTPFNLIAFEPEEE